MCRASQCPQVLVRRLFTLGDYWNLLGMLVEKECPSVKVSWMADMKCTEEFMPSGLKNPQEAIATWKKISKNKINFIRGTVPFLFCQAYGGPRTCFHMESPSEIWSTDLGRSFTKMTEEIHSEVKDLYLIGWCLKWCHCLFWIFSSLPKYIWKWWWSRLH